MANIAFYHSFPNNLPGVLWYTNKMWQGLVQGRVISPWLLELLDRQSNRANTTIPCELLNLLTLVKHGIRRIQSVALRLNVDKNYAKGLIEYAIDLGLLTPNFFLTPDGLDRLFESSKTVSLPKWDRELYIPSSWCAGRATVQPLTNEGFFQRLADSVKVSTSADGDVG